MPERTAALQSCEVGLLKSLSDLPYDPPSLNNDVAAGSAQAVPLSRSAMKTEVLSVSEHPRCLTAAPSGAVVIA